MVSPTLLFESGYENVWRERGEVGGSSSEGVVVVVARVNDEEVRLFLSLVSFGGEMGRMEKNSG